MQQLQVSTDFLCSTSFKQDKLLLTKSVCAEKIYCHIVIDA